MKSFTFPILSIFILLTGSLLAEDGKELFQNKCTACHSITMPMSHNDLKAPPAVGFMFHLKEHFTDKTKLKEHIINFTTNPTYEKAVCRSVRRFGVMPSQKENVTQEELAKIADWLIGEVSLSKEHYYKQKKEMLGN
jgi:cytochrome c